VAAAHGVAADVAGVGCYERSAGEAESAVEVAFLRGGGREAVHALGYLYHALFALALHLAGGGDADTDAFGAGEEGGAERGLGFEAVDGEG